MATDLEIIFIEQLELANLEVRRHDITCDRLEAQSFDLVHARKALEHLPKPEESLVGCPVVARHIPAHQQLYCSTPTGVSSRCRWWGSRIATRIVTSPAAMARAIA